MVTVSPVVLSSVRGSTAAGRSLSAEVMPTHGPLVDPYGRVHSDLRISLTDRCNLRCIYCMPAEGMRFQHSAEHLTTEEVVRFAAVARQLGVRSVRLTGGEPLLRHDIVEIVRRLRRLGFDDLSLTTNGTRLASLAPALADAGLDRANVSCDSLNADRFSAMRRGGDLKRVLAAMDAAEAAGLQPIKVNVVVLVGHNDDEVEAFAAFGRSTGRPVRFIEYMPLDGEGTWERSQVLPSRQVIERIHRLWPLEPVEHPLEVAPARRWRFSDGSGEIGVIASVTEQFCGSCNRLRLTADGSVRNCLFSNRELSARQVLRGPGDDEELARLVRRAVWGKLPGHAINDPGFLRPRRTMSMIGG